MDTENLSCVTPESPNEELEEYVARRLEADNERQSPWILQKRISNRGPRAIQVFLRNQAGDTFGDVMGFTLWDWLEDYPPGHVDFWFRKDLE